MAQETQILNTREIKKIREFLIKDFGYFLEEDYVYLQNSQDKIFLVNKTLDRLNLKNLIIDKFGLYFGELKDQQFRLSKEGAQLLFLEAKNHQITLKNTLELSSKEVKEYFLGLDLEQDLGPENRNLILIFQGNCLGSVRYKDKKILNFLPKIYRGEAII